MQTQEREEQEDEDEAEESSKAGGMRRRGRVGGRLMHLHTGYKLCLCNSDPHKCDVNMLEWLYL